MSGRKRVVIGGELAHTILVTARMSNDAGVSLFLLDLVGKAAPALVYQRGRAIGAQCAEAVGSMEEASA